MKRLLKGFFAMGMSQVATTLVAIVRNKLLAVLLGPEGVGLLAQLTSFQTLAASAIPMGMLTGALKYFAEFRGKDDRKLAVYVKTACWVFLCTAGVTVAVCFVFIKPIAGWVLNDPKLWVFLIPPLLGVPFLIQSQVWFTYLQSGLEMKTYGKTMVASSLVGIVIVVPVVLVWRLWGASWHILLAAVLMYAMVRFQVSRRMEPRMKADMKSAEFSLGALRQLARFGVANLPVFAIGTAAPFLIRRQIIADLGLHDNGIYQALYAITSTYLNMPVNALNMYAMAKISQLSDKDEINAEVNNTVRVALLINTALVLAVVLNREVLVRVLFSSKFSGAVELFPWQVMGDFFRFMTYAVAASIIPQERFRARSIMCIVQWLGYFAVFYAVPSSLRLHGAVWGEVTNWFLAFAMMFGYMRWLNGYRFTRQIWISFCASLFAISFVSFMPGHGLSWRLVGWGVAVLWAATACSSGERAKLFGLVREVLSRGGGAAQAESSQAGDQGDQAQRHTEARCVDEPERRS